ncbi:hypothetical protein BDZ97DRAFT_1760922 [Flammula alnicola]|nr:hypothetical protein BDZ97DRAFT_1760922 [Flammula alnicola]
MTKQIHAGIRLFKQKQPISEWLNQTFMKVQYKKKPQPGPTAQAFQNLRLGQSQLQANTIGPAWPGFFWPGLAWLLASGQSWHITTFDHTHVLYFYSLVPLHDSNLIQETTYNKWSFTLFNGINAQYWKMLQILIPRVA